MARYSKIVKTCMNENCQGYHIKTEVERNIIYCPHCGQRLRHVCNAKNCFAILDDPDAKLCDKHEQAQLDKPKIVVHVTTEFARELADLAKTAAPVAITVVSVGKEVPKIAKNVVQLLRKR